MELELSSGGESAACDLSTHLKDGLRGSISYSARYTNNMQDKAMFDDILTIQIDEKTVAYQEFASEMFEQITRCFKAYRASIVHDLDLDLDDYSQIVELSQATGKDIDGRDSVFRLNPINFFDNELCERSFQINASEVESRLEDHIERVAVQDGGVLVIVTSDLVDTNELEKVHDHVASLLGTEMGRI